ncbi:hypothetical protein QAD02_018761 [Eretmocerus hayati]|uniref:Uncharacterized protein n=1 Tax=Eretmocerus hayati TaxID=131215 RepID=A0ACC2PK50_9HYME|nr:hypothetical protein QAD02_018761 [Eretmocerus hayati]
MAANTNYLDFDQEVRNDVLEAIRAGDVPALQHLIDTRFGVNNDSNTDCLYHAVREGNSQIVKMLLDAGIRRDYYRMNVNVDEDQDDEHQVIANLDERADAFLDRAENRARASPLYFAIRLQDDELRWTMVKLLVDNGISPRNEHLYSPSALFLAVLQGDYEMVKYLLDAGAQVDCVCDYGKGFTTLHGAVVYLSGEIRVNMVKLLLKFGADVNAKGPIHRERCVQLVFEEQLGRCEVLQLLIDAGAELNYLDENYESPLAIAASMGDCEAMRQLITAGADVNLSNRCSSSPLHVSMRQKSLAILPHIISVTYSYSAFCGTL